VIAAAVVSKIYVDIRISNLVSEKHPLIIRAKRTSASMKISKSPFLQAWAAESPALFAGIIVVIPTPFAGMISVGQLSNCRPNKNKETGADNQICGVCFKIPGVSSSKKIRGRILQFNSGLCVFGMGLSRFVVSVGVQV
jgi:hypothetical protein